MFRWFKIICVSNFGGFISLVVMGTKNDVFEVIKNQLKENQIVTFKWLSRTLKLHNTLAKKYLDEFVQSEPESKFVVTTLVFGKKENGELLMMLTKEKDDTQFTGKNITVIDKQVYSIQPIQSNFDTAMIYSIDKSTYELQNMRLSSINYHTKIIRKSNSTKVAVTNESIKNYVNGDGKTKMLKQNTTRSYSDIETNDSSEKEENLKERCTSNNCKGETSDGNKEKAKISVTNGQITSFFIKRNVEKNPVTNDEIARTLDKESQAESNSVLGLKSNSPFEQKAEDVIKPKKTLYLPKKTLKINTLGKASSSQKIKQKQENNKKQRKRILSSLDSDSECESDSNNNSDNREFDSDQELQLEQKLVKEAEVPRVTIMNGKKRKRKEIINEVVDDKGYLNTIIETVYESCDSDEKDEEVKEIEEPSKSSKVNELQLKNPSKRAKVEVADMRNQKTKQVSILSFFKKPQQS